MFEFIEKTGQVAKLKVVGVGGGGCNAINTMIASNLEGVEFIAANTDVQALKNSKASVRLQLGEALTKGLGAGADPHIGKNAALEDIDKIRENLEGADMIFIAAGLGGGTGTGAAPVIAEAAKALGALTVAIVTKPFNFEGKRRRRIAEEGLKELADKVDSLIAIPNQRLISVVERQTSFVESFKMADEVLLHGLKSISDLVTVPGLINLDFADVKTIMSERGMAFMGIGIASGEDRAKEAARKAISSPLLEDISISGARGLLINIAGSSTLSLHEVDEAVSLIQQEAHDDEDSNIIFGAVIDDSLGDRIQITVIATGFDRTAELLQEQFGSEFAANRLTRDAPVANAAGFSGALFREPAKVIKLGTIISEFADDGAYDIPTFIRNQADYK
ncbi:MAG: cell division protein FtsZ [Proteobacteria bacterium]|nr:cell division protein FtsZ [Pseudomonadota bacterium]